MAFAGREGGEGLRDSSSSDLISVFAQLLITWCQGMSLIFPSTGEMSKIFFLSPRRHLHSDTGLRVTSGALPLFSYSNSFTFFHLVLFGNGVFFKNMTADQSGLKCEVYDVPPGF